MPSNGTGCAPGARCIRVRDDGRPRANGTWVAQCRGEFADFIVPRDTIPANYNGPWFQPNLIEEAHTGIPSGTRPWRSFDPDQDSQRLAYVLALRNYAFASEPVRSITPQLTADSDYFDPIGGSVPQNQRTQKWYPAPRMMYGLPGSPGAASREAARGMTAERTVPEDELGGNTEPLRNYAVAYYDARGARTFARVWGTSTPGLDAVDRSQMRFSAGGFVYKLLFSAARPTRLSGRSGSARRLARAQHPSQPQQRAGQRASAADRCRGQRRARWRDGLVFRDVCVRSDGGGELGLEKNGPSRLDVGQRSKRLHRSSTPGSIQVRRPMPRPISVLVGG